MKNGLKYVEIGYIGADDVDLKLFENQYEIPNGISYNSYILRDGENVVFDASDDRTAEIWLTNLERALDGAKPDYLIVSHVEPDHSSAIPVFAKKYPSATLVGNDKTFAMLKNYYGEIPLKKLTVKDGDALKLKNRQLKFFFAPMVHWPEVMMTYDEKSGVLFSADAFGKFGALSHKEDWTDEARRYYINIVGKYGLPVQNALKKLSALKINAIYPLHGPVLDKNLSFYLEKYERWSTYRAEEDGVLIACASAHGNTYAACQKLLKLLKSRGVKAELADLNCRDLSYSVAGAFRYSALVLASITYEGGLMPAAEAFLNKLKSKNYQSRTVGLIQNGSWAPASGKIMRAAFGEMKDISLCGTIVTVNSALNCESEKQLSSLADELASVCSSERSA